MWRKYSNTYEFLWIYAFGIFIFPVVFLYLHFRWGFNFIWGGIAFVISSLIALFILSYRAKQMKRFKEMESNLNKYINFVGTHLYVKPKNSTSWLSYKEWVKSILKDKMNEDST